MGLLEVAAFNIVFAVTLAVLLQSMPTHRTWARCVAVLPLMALTAIYTICRVSSLPTLAFNVYAIWPWIFFTFEFIAIVYETWTAGVMTRMSDHSSDADRYELMLRGSRHLPTVDVFIATYNEGVEIVTATILAAMAIDYPKHLLRIYVNDDGNRDELKKKAAELGVEYVARPTVKRADGREEQAGGKGKGGNDRYAFTRSSGKYIVLVDADFRLRPDFLYRTLGFLMFRRDVGLVQTPQRFVNGDVVAHNLGAAKSVPDDQHFFMTVMQASRDAWRNAFCTGTGCIVSRAALQTVDPVWGFPNSTICEDLELSYALLNFGYITVYLNEPLAYGLAPEAIAEFLKQRVRWCTGTIQNLVARTGPIRGNLAPIDRLFYLDGAFYWLGSIFMVFLILAPLVFWTTGIPAVTGSPEATFETLLPRLIARELIVYWLSAGTVPPVVVYVSRSVPAFHVSVAIVKTFLFPTSGVFEVTSKAAGDRFAVYWPLFSIFGAIGCLTAVAIAISFVGRSSVVAVSDSLQLNVVWSTVSVIACVMCALACVDCPHPAPGEHREVTRSNPMEIARALVCRWLGLERKESR